VNVQIPWDFVALGAWAGFGAGLMLSIPLIWWSTRTTKEEKNALRYLRDNPKPDPG
jgi:hypothetical protein